VDATPPRQKACLWGAAITCALPAHLWAPLPTRCACVHGRFGRVAKVAMAFPDPRSNNVRSRVQVPGHVTQACGPWRGRTSAAASPSWGPRSHGRTMCGTPPGAKHDVLPQGMAWTRRTDNQCPYHRPSHLGSYQPPLRGGGWGRFMPTSRPQTRSRKGPPFGALHAQGASGGSLGLSLVV
jgi:hypothetical protein